MGLVICLTFFDSSEKVILLLPLPDPIEPDPVESDPDPVVTNSLDLEYSLLIFLPPSGISANWDPRLLEVTFANLSPDPVVTNSLDLIFFLRCSILSTSFLYSFSLFFTYAFLWFTASTFCPLTLNLFFWYVLVDLYPF